MKKLTEEERLKKEREKCLKDAESEYQLVNPKNPTHFFEVGQKVAYGGMLEAVVENVFRDGAYYLLLCTTKDNNYGNPIIYKTYRTAAWWQIRPLWQGEDTKVRKNENVNIQYYNSTIESLLHRYYFFGIDMDPVYQRGYVWDTKDKDMLITSIFNNVDIGKFVMVELDKEEWKKRRVGYEILDGKQRLSTIVDFFEGRFPYNGKYFNDLSPQDRNFFMNHTVSLASLSDISKEDVLNTFFVLNTTGKRVGDEQIKKVLEMMEEYKNAD